MFLLKATIKAPLSLVSSLKESLTQLGVSDVEVQMIHHAQFVQESRLNYDCVFPQLWESAEDAAYLQFSFEDSAEGRDAAYHVEFHLPQIPLNLRYESAE